MSDVTVNETKADHIEEIKLKGGVGTVSVNFSAMAEEGYRLCLVEGATSIINAVGMSKILPGVTKLEGKEKEERIIAILKQAGENVEALMAGTISKGRRASGEKVSGAVQTEAMRLARMLVKDHIKSMKQRIGAYSAAEITEGAKKVLAGNPQLLEQAKANLARAAEEAKATGGLDLVSLLGEKANSDEVKAKPKNPPKPKAKKGEPLSAKQAALVAPRQKPAHTLTH